MKQRTQGSSFSDWWDIIHGIPQGSILGPLSFNIFTKDSICFVSKSALHNFGWDMTIRVSGIWQKYRHYGKHFYRWK